MIDTLCTECGHRLSFPNQYAGTARSCHFCGAIVSLPEQQPLAARVPAGAQKSVRIKRPAGPFGLDKTYFIVACSLFGFAVLLTITGYLTGQTGSPFSLTLFVLGFILLVGGVSSTALALIDVDILSEWSRVSFTVPTAIVLFIPVAALGGLTAYLTYSP